MTGLPKIYGQHTPVSNGHSTKCTNFIIKPESPWTTTCSQSVPQYSTGNLEIIQSHRSQYLGENAGPSKRSKLYRNLWWNPCHGMAKHQIPKGYTWKEYMYFLLDTFPEETKQSYLGKTKGKQGILEIPGRMPRFVNHT